MDNKELKGGSQRQACLYKPWIGGDTDDTQSIFLFLMPSLLSKFTKNTNAQAAPPEVDRTNAAHRRRQPSLGGPSSSTSTTSSTSGSKPRLVLTASDAGPFEQQILSPESLHRVESMPPNALVDEHGRISQNGMLTDSVKNDQGRTMSDAGWQGADDDLTPGPRRSHSPSQRSQTVVPSIPTSPGNTTMTMTNPASRRSSTSGPASEFSANFAPEGILSTSPTEDSHLLPHTTSPPRGKRGWGRRSSQASSDKSASKTRKQSRIHPSGGLASAIAGSGLALANPAMNILPQAMPAPGSRPRQGSSASEIATSTVPNRHEQSRMLNMSNGGHGDDVEDEPGDASDVNDSDAEDDEEDTSPDELDPLADGVAPITGFAVASNKRNADFHALFPSVPDGDYLIDDYGCALQREILIQGRLYISENHLSFHANIFGWTTDVRSWSSPLHLISHFHIACCTH